MACTADKNSSLCAIEKNIKLLTEALSNQIKIQKLDFLENSPQVFRRDKRGFLWIGNIFHYCCELITTKLYAKQASNIKDLNSHLNRVLDLTRETSNNTFLLKKHYDEFTNQVKHVTDAIAKNLINLQEQLNNKNASPDTAAYFHGNMQNLWQAIMQTYKFSNLRNVKAHCNVKKLSKSILPVDYLRKDLQILQERLREQNHDIEVNLDTELESIYDLPLTTYLDKKYFKA